MAAPTLLGLPPVTPELKSIAPYLQRADELRKSEPIVSYWCAYYAAQMGISLKAKDTPSRTLLFELLGVLEKLKSDIGATDAIDIESVSAAYVENFALKVFGMADNEDRRGQATRSTAKKFLAAANFLEVLKTFPKTEFSDTTEEKIRYAKWKAADIAKAFREGRKPVAGPPDGGDQSPPEIAPSLTATSTSSTLPVNSTVTSTSKRRSSSPPKKVSPPGSRNHSPPHISRSSPPRLALTPDYCSPSTPPRTTHMSLGPSLTPNWGGQGDVTPGSWSTAATPGTSTGNPFSAAGATFNLPSLEEESPSAGRGKTATERKKRSGSGSSSGSTASTGGKKTVHFTPSVTGGLSSTAGSPPVSPGAETGGFDLPPSTGPATFSPVHASHPPTQVNGYSQLPSPHVIPPYDQQHHLQPSAPPFDHHAMLHHSHVPQQQYPDANTQQFTPSPPVQAPYAQPPSMIIPPVPPAPVPVHFSVSPPAPPLAPEPIVEPPQELTPAMIAKAQKHCRFAISSLDYEDLEQARKELRAALNVLGG